MKKIAWITPDYFIDVDLPIIDRLNSNFNINWLIIIHNSASIDYEKFILKNITSKNKINITFHYLKYRSSSPKTIIALHKIIKEAKSYKPDLYYLSYSGMPYGICLYKLLLPIKKCVIACHNVTTPKGATSEKIASFYTDWWLSSFKNIQVFSKGQYTALTNKYSNKNILMAPLAIKDYGEPEKIYDKINTKPIRFLFFGNIVEYKRLDILIEAANLLSQRTTNFKVRIAGVCNNWSKYQEMIKESSHFELQITRIPNEQVANLFADSHYFVMPYQDIAQSGAITVAFRYNLPTIVSDIEQFREFVVPDVTGLTFQSENAKDLAEKMLYVINNHYRIYEKLCSSQKEYVEKELSIDSIVMKYTKYLNSI